MGLGDVVDDLATDRGFQIGFAVVLLGLAAVIAVTRSNLVQLFLALVVAAYALARLYVLVVKT